MLEKYGETKLLMMMIASIERFMDDRQKGNDIWKNGSLAQLWLVSGLLYEVVISYDPNWDMIREQIDKIYERTGITK